MALRPRKSKGTNVPPAASKSVGENEVASRQRTEVPLVEHKVVLKPRREVQEIDPMVQMVEMMEGLQ